MVHESLRSLRLDRRLLHRRSWLSEEERQRELSALPDVSEKIAPPEPDLEADAQLGKASSGSPETGDAGA